MSQLSMGYLLLSVQNALLDAVTPELRAVSVAFDVRIKQLFLHFFYDGILSDAILDLVSVASAEVETGPSYTEHYTSNGQLAIRLDYPKPIPVYGYLAYLRKEPMPLDFIAHSRPRPWWKWCWPLCPSKELLGKRTPYPYLHSPTTMGPILLRLQELFLGKITPNLRRAVIKNSTATKDEDNPFDIYPESIITIIFIFDGEIPSDQYLWIDQLPARLNQELSHLNILTEVVRLDAPNRIPSYQGICAYQRREIRS